MSFSSHIEFQVDSSPALPPGLLAVEAPGVGGGVPREWEARGVGFRRVEEVSVTDCVVAHLEAEEVDAVFGIPGGNIAPFQQALRRHGAIRFVIASHEGGAAFMADGYARATGKLGVCLVTAGPGATNALTGVASAHLDGVPLLAISGQVATDRFGLNAIQESTGTHGVNTVELFRQASAMSAGIVDAQSFQRLLARVLRVVHGLPGGAAHLSIPSNIARQRIRHALLPTTRGAFRARPPAAAPEDLDETFQLLRAARRPLIVLGSGAREALGTHGEAFTAFVSEQGIPVATSLRGKGLFSETEPLSLGVLGLAGSRRAEAYVREGVDVLLVLGSRMGEWASRGFNKHLQAIDSVIQVDAQSAHIGQFLPVRLPIVADVGSVVAGLVERGRRSGPPGGERLRERWSRMVESREPVPSPRAPQAEGMVKPQQLMAELNAHLRPNMDLYIDMGNCTGWASHLLRLTPPTRIFFPCGLSSMGWSCGAVIGGKLGRPERAAVAITGDGAFLMNGTELLTASRYRVGTVTLVLNDNFLGMVNHGEHAQDTTVPLEDDFYGLGDPDLAAFAESLGARAYTVDGPGQLAALLPEVLRRADELGQPQVIIARVDYREVPPYGDRFAAVASDGR
ncbi:Acetohydroxy acid synthase [Cystobacter fuscus DSM 2262]|uniref:Acetohydroxy acid synthase n=1 Tax=Cystobacter fuscus (strain ATCC 25194 / DSM 2262 / NBRC 100088 / M29) TaxID=1242864 RepID=S9NYG7_CYSF2|nr:thiamine pyrophosphate-binding protein [Cystobacter fuscus]EPX57265.1 Acetohydroxy acid synthase [Cystobacter fuscus DSM 2262]